MEPKLFRGQRGRGVDIEHTPVHRAAEQVALGPLRVPRYASHTKNTEHVALFGHCFTIVRPVFMQDDGHITQYLPITYQSQQEV